MSESNAVWSSNIWKYWATYKVLPRTHQIFLQVVVLQCLYVISERLYVMVSEYGHSGRGAIWFFVVIMLSLYFLFYFAFHSIMHVNEFELFAFLMSSVSLVVRICFEFYSRADRCRNHQGQCASMLAINIAFNAIHWYMYCRMAQDLRWTRYKAIGADPTVRRVYQRYELFSAMRKLDVQFSVIILVTGIVFMSDSVDALPGLIPNVVLFLIEIVWERIGVLGVKGESAAYLFAFWGLSLCLPAFIIAVLIVSASSSPLFNRIRDNDEAITILIFAIMSLLSRIVTVASSVLLFREFGEGYVGLRKILRDGRTDVFDRVHATHNRPQHQFSNGVQLGPVGASGPVTIVDVRDIKSDGKTGGGTTLRPAREQTILNLPTGIIGGPKPGTAGSTLPIQPSVPPELPGAVVNPLNHVPKAPSGLTSDAATPEESKIIERAAARRAQKAEIEAKAASAKRRK